MEGAARWRPQRSGIQVTCFTGTKVRILTQKALRQMAAANVEGDSCLFRLPYVAARYKMQKEFDDYVCCDRYVSICTFVPVKQELLYQHEALTRTRCAARETSSCCRSIRSQHTSAYVSILHKRHRELRVSVAASVFVLLYW